MGRESFIDHAVLTSFDADDFAARQPFPWHLFEELIKPAAFQRLLTDFPPINLFTWSEGKPPRPQKRWLLLHDPEQPEHPESVPRTLLPAVWQQFIDELTSSRTYGKLVSRGVGLADIHTYFSWHLDVAGTEVCPARGKTSKLAVHAFYFNTPSDWDRRWGGDLVLLGNYRGTARHPELAEFGTDLRVPTLGNRSFFYRNGPHAWQAMHALTCRDNAYRRVFNVVFARRAAPSRNSRMTLARLRAKARRFRNVT